MLLGSALHRPGMHAEHHPAQGVIPGRWREAVRLDAALNADEVLVQVRAALAQDLDAPSALAAVDAWAGASTAIDSDDAESPALVARACDALLGVVL